MNPLSGPTEPGRTLAGQVARADALDSVDLWVVRMILLLLPICAR